MEERREGRPGVRAGTRRGEEGLATPTPGPWALTPPLGLGVISPALSVLLPPPPLGSGVPVATRGASLPITRALPARSETMRCPGARWRVAAAQTPRDGPRSAAAGAFVVSEISARLSPPLPPNSSPFSRQQSLSPDFSSERERGARAQGREGMGIRLFSWVCRPLRYRYKGGKGCHEFPPIIHAFSIHPSIIHLLLFTYPPPSIYPSVHPSSVYSLSFHAPSSSTPHLSMHPPTIHLSTHPSFTHASSSTYNTSIHVCTHSSMHLPSICSSIHPSTYPCTYRASIHHPYTHHSFLYHPSFTHPSMHQQKHPPSYPPFTYLPCLSILLCTYSPSTLP